MGLANEQSVYKMVIYVKQLQFKHTCTLNPLGHKDCVRLLRTGLDWSKGQLHVLSCTIDE